MEDEQRKSWNGALDSRHNIETEDVPQRDGPAQLHPKRSTHAMVLYVQQGFQNGYG